LSGSNNTIVVDISDKTTLSSLTGGTITPSSTTSTNTDTSSDTESDSTETLTTLTLNALNDISSSTSVVTVSTSAAQSGSYTISMYLSQSWVINLDYSFDNDGGTSTFSQYSSGVTVGCYIRSGSETDDTRQFSTVLQTATSLAASGLSQTGTFNVKQGVNTFVLGTIDLVPSTTYYLVPFVKVSRNKITGATIYPFVRRSTGTMGAGSTFDASIDIRVPKLKDIQVYQTVSKSELIAGGMQVIRDTNNYVKMDRTTSGTMLEVGGAITATGNITAYYSSDERLKENIVPIDSALDKIDKINGVYFDWTDEYIQKETGGKGNDLIKKHDVGVIAQEIENVLPEVVVTRTDGYKAIRYEKLVALLIQSVKELKKEIDILKNKL
jgi:hypothetical protein